MGKLLEELDLLNDLKMRIESGLPVLGTCAGLILLASKIADNDAAYFKTLPVTVIRNAYGRQLGSFCTEASFGDFKNIPMKFIRAPYIKSANKDVKVLSIVDGRIVAVQYRNQLGIAFHPELTDSDKVHQYFIDIVKCNMKDS
ncbi:5'-phosphate synthase pdxT subunit [Mobilisporobacter senegalensis]|uniref:5'-phosphate synthase pdxT subunit n=1 Tax=Mobilisporobacter senegalensis TaxID=1329262 RepID=A0A3N1XMR3_9FIRM|nr:pyridoxal 5'-phosphate synthase glutaminase subunit PdxT [Mobilisporobacter senegalensis]ROR27421.1 5'-phosphate synthase pdxT subunit [Mobilisporobacter senegalensis]